MTFLPILLLLLLASIIAPLFDRWLRRRAVAAQATPTTPTESSFKLPTLLSVGKDKIQRQVAQLLGKQTTIADTSLQNWLATLFAENSDERLWLMELTPAQFAKLRSNLNNFCSKLGVDLTWLAGETSFRSAKLDEAGKAILTHYCQAVRQALLVSDDINALEHYQALLTNPTNKKNLAFAQTLFAHLVDEGLVSPASPELLMASAKERQTYMIQAIQTAAQNDDAFQRVLNQVVANDLPPPAPTEASVPEMHKAISPANVAA